MELFQSKKKFQLKKMTPIQGLATQIFDDYKGDIRFGIIIGLIKLKGEEFIKRAWLESKNAKKPRALFLWKCAQTKVNFRNETKIFPFSKG